MVICLIEHKVLCAPLIEGQSTWLTSHFVTKILETWRVVREGNRPKTEARLTDSVHLICYLRCSRNLRDEARLDTKIVNDIGHCIVLGIIGRPYPPADLMSHEDAVCAYETIVQSFP